MVLECIAKDDGADGLESIERWFIGGFAALYKALWCGSSSEESLLLTAGPMIALL